MAPKQRRRLALWACGVAAGVLLVACGGPGATTSRSSVGPPPLHSALPGGLVRVPPPSGPTLSPPVSIASNCSTDVSTSLTNWLSSLQSGQTVLVRAGACYRVDEGIKLEEPRALTIFGGTYRDESTAPGEGPRSKGSPAFVVVGGSHVTFESMRISGANPGGYHPRLAFAGGIELEGTAGVTIRGVTISDTFGDGVTLAPLRGGANHNSGHILAPVSGVTIRDLTVEGAGRQGVTFASVSGAQLADVVVSDPGLDTFDFEADQANEGAKNVTIDGCAASGGALFFANGGKGNGRDTGTVTVENCSMSKPEGGSAVLVERPAYERIARGPFDFVSDDLWCGASAYVACVQLSGAEVTLSHVTLRFPSTSTHEAVYHLQSGSDAVFEDDSVEGYGKVGNLVEGSSVHVSGGRWNQS